MDKTITTALFIVVSMILVLVLFNVAYPAVVQGGDAVASMANSVADEMRNHIDIIHADAELDHTGWWQDVNNNGLFDVFVWVKNTGDVRITALNQIDVFFGPEGNFSRIPAQGDADGAYPYWTGQVAGSTNWDPTATLQITIHYQTPLAGGRYFMKVVLPDGVSSDDYLGM